MHAVSVHARIAALSATATVALAAGGCSSSPAASSAQPVASVSAGAPAATASAPTSEASPTGLAAKLLTPADLPAGWHPQIGAANPAPRTDCGLLNTADWNTALTGHAEADLIAGGAGPYLVEQIAAGTPAQVGQAWQKLIGGLGACTTYTHGGANGSSTFSIARTALPAYGDSSYSFTLEIKVSSGIDAMGYIVAARTGNSVVVVYLVGLTQPDRRMVEAAVNTAVAKART
jgi:hypothetical protein